MKLLSIKFKIAILTIGLIIISMGDIYGADWKLYDFDDYRLDYYDAQGITRPSKNIVRVWTRWNFTKKGAINCVERFGKKYENLGHSILLWEINCIEKTARYLSMANFDNKGGVIDYFSSPSEGYFFFPESNMEILYKEICK